MNKVKTAILFGSAFYTVAVLYMIFAVFVGDIYANDRALSNWSQGKLFWWGTALWTFYTPFVAGLYVSLSNKAGIKPSVAISITSGSLAALVCAVFSGSFEHWLPGNQFYVVFGFLALLLLAAVFAGWNIENG